MYNVMWLHGVLCMKENLASLIEAAKQRSIDLTKEKSALEKQFNFENRKPCNISISYGCKRPAQLEAFIMEAGYSVSIKSDSLEQMVLCLTDKKPTEDDKRALDILEKYLLAHSIHEIQISVKAVGSFAGVKYFINVRLWDLTVDCPKELALGSNQGIYDQIIFTGNCLLNLLKELT